LTRSLTTTVALLLALAAAALAVPTTSSAARAACVPGTTTVAGKKAMRFCGPAKATATVGTKRFAFSGGECSVAGTYFTVNIGTILIHRTAHGKPGPSPYFGVTVTPSGPGLHLGQVLSWASGGKGYSLLGTRITLASGLKSGSFTGRSLDGKKARGTFTCE
jgi:hypothetical protein